jgi:hypothetical protein
MGTFVEKCKMPLKVVMAGVVVAALVLLLGNALIAELTVLAHPSEAIQVACLKDGPAIVARDGSWTSHVAPNGQLLYDITLGDGRLVLTADEVREHCLSKLTSPEAFTAFFRTLTDPFGLER